MRMEDDYYSSDDEGDTNNNGNASTTDTVDIMSHHPPLHHEQLLLLHSNNTMEDAANDAAMEKDMIHYSMAAAAAAAAASVAVCDGPEASPTNIVMTAAEKRHHSPRAIMGQCCHRPRSRRRQRLSTALFLLLGSSSPLFMEVVANTTTTTTTTTAGGGYLTNPPSRNYLAYTLNSHLPTSTSHPLSSLPELEPTPHSLNSGQTCGTADGGERNYNHPKNRLDQLLPLNIQSVYYSSSSSSSSGGEIEVTVQLFDERAGGHFEFSACPLQYPEGPAEDCFERYPLEFVRDGYYGAVKDDAYPGRAYVPYSSAFVDTSTNNNGNGGGGVLQRIIGQEAGPGGTKNMMEFSYTFRLPRAVELLTADSLGPLEQRQGGGVVVPDGEYAEGRWTDDALATSTKTMGQQFLEHHEEAGQDNGGGRALLLELLEPPNRNSFQHHQQQQQQPSPARRLQSELPLWLQQQHDEQLENQNQWIAANQPWHQKESTSSSKIVQESRAKQEQEPRQQLEPRQQQWIATQQGTNVVASQVETVLISSLSTDGNGTTTIVTLHGPVTVVEGGPKVAQSSTLSYGSKAIYGEGIDVGELPEFVREEMLNSSGSGSGSGSSSISSSSISSSSSEGVDGGAGGGAVAGAGGGGDNNNANAGRPLSPAEANSEAGDDGWTPASSTSAAHAFASGGSPSSGGGGAGTANNDASSTGAVGTSAGAAATGAGMENDGGMEPISALWSDASNNSANDDSPSNYSIITPPNSKYVLLRWHYTTARDCHPPGYDSYQWPMEWGEWKEQWGGECNKDLEGGEGNNGGGAQVEYWNCAEILIVGDDGSGAAEGSGIGGAEGELNGASGPEAYNEDASLNTEPMIAEGLPTEDYAVTIEEKPFVINNAADQNSIFAKDDTAVTNSGISVAIDVTSNDIGTSLKVTSARAGRHGECMVSERNKVVYTANSGFVGRDRCAYMVCLGEREDVCDEGWVYVEVLEPGASALAGNDGGAPGVGGSASSLGDADAGGSSLNFGGDNASGPQAQSSGGTIAAVDDGIITYKNQPIRVDVTANDEYAGAAIVTETTNALQGTCAVTNDNKVLYTPAEDFEGWDRCTYKVCLAQSPDIVNEAVCNYARIKIKVIGSLIGNDYEVGSSNVPVAEAKPVPEPMMNTEDGLEYEDMEVYSSNSDPVATPDSIEAVEGASALIDVLANDEDPDGDSLAVYSWTSPESGGNVEEEGGQLRYTPAEGFTGNDSFKYTMCDTTERCSTATVSIKVTQKPSEVFTQDDEATTAGDTPIIIDVTANDSSSSNKPLVVSDVNRAKHGTCELVGNQVRYTPPGEFVGWDRCAYMVCSDGECDKGRVEVKVLPTQIYDEVAANSNNNRPARPPRPMASEQKEDATEDEPDTRPIPTANKPEVQESTFESGQESSSGQEEGAGLEKVYAEDELVVTSLNAPITIDVTSNDFVKGMGELKLTHTGGAENGDCKLSNNQVKYTPQKGFVGTDHCGYIVCQANICDEGIVAIKVMDQMAAVKKPLQHEENGDDLVSNHESSEGLTLGVEYQSARAGSSGSAAVEVDCNEEGRGRNLRGGRRLDKHDPCIGSSLVDTTSTTASGNDEITYTSTHKKETTQSSSLLHPLTSALRYGRTASSPSTEEESRTETIITVPATADAVIMPGFPDKCFGSVPSMLISSAQSNAGLHETVLQFETAGVDSSVCNDGVLNANIFVYALVHSSQGGTFVTTSDDSWLEDEVTWNNAPKSDGIVLSDLNSIEAKKWYGVDASSALILGETLSIRILSNEGAKSVAQYASRDHSDKSLKPVLNITCLSLDE